MDISAVVIHATHVLAVVFLIGAAIYATLSGTGFSAGVRSRIFVALGLLVVTGFYQFMLRMQAGPMPKGYHMWFGIKMLLALHVLAVFLLIALGRGDEAKQRRWATGIAISGSIAILLASVLRSL